MLKMCHYKGFFIVPSLLLDFNENEPYYPLFGIRMNMQTCVVVNVLLKMYTEFVSMPNKFCFLVSMPRKGQCGCIYVMYGSVCLEHEPALSGTC